MARLFKIFVFCAPKLSKSLQFRPSCHNCCMLFMLGLNINHLKFRINEDQLPKSKKQLEIQRKEKEAEKVKLVTSFAPQESNSQLTRPAIDQQVIP
jgi:hypothetical protein